MLAQEGLEDRRLTVFAGPVLADDDPLYRGIVQVPVSTGRSSCTASRGGCGSSASSSPRTSTASERAVPDFLDEFDTYLVRSTCLKTAPD